MESSTLAAPVAARPIFHDLERVEGSTELLQDLERHIQALRGMCSHVTRPTLQKLLGIELSLTEACLRRFTIVREDPAASLNPSS